MGTTESRTRRPGASRGRRGSIASEVQRFIEDGFRNFRWQINVTDWLGNEYSAGRREGHFSGKPLEVRMHTEAAGRDLLRLDGLRFLERFDGSTYELNEGDYREDERVYDHLTSTGMVSHVGPRGLVPYVKEVRKRIKRGGRYLHHSLMTAHQNRPLDFNVGITFNKKYVWPGFHWFTVGDHVRALEKNGFQVEKMVNLTFHYAKTTTAWYERMMANEETMLKNLGKPTLRAWQIFLAGITGAYLMRDVHVYRLYCVAT